MPKEQLVSSGSMNNEKVSLVLDEYLTNNTPCFYQGLPRNAVMGAREKVFNITILTLEIVSHLVVLCVPGPLAMSACNWLRAHDRMLGCGPRSFNVCILNKQSCPGPVAQLVGASSCTLKGCGFDPPSGQVLRLWV